MTETIRGKTGLEEDVQTLHKLLEKLQSRYVVCATWQDEYGGWSSCDNVRVYLNAKEKWVDDNGWVIENGGVTAKCPECQSYKEGTMAWTIEHYQKCKWLPKDVKGILDKKARNY